MFSIKVMIFPRVLPLELFTIIIIIIIIKIIIQAYIALFLEIQQRFIIQTN